MQRSAGARERPNHHGPAVKREFDINLATRRAAGKSPSPLANSPFETLAASVTFSGQGPDVAGLRAGNGESPRYSAGSRWKEGCPLSLSAWPRPINPRAPDAITVVRRIPRGAAPDNPRSGAARSSIPIARKVPHGTLMGICPHSVVGLNPHVPMSPEHFGPPAPFAARPLGGRADGFINA